METEQTVSLTIDALLAEWSAEVATARLMWATTDAKRAQRSEDRADQFLAAAVASIIRAVGSQRGDVEDLTQALLTAASTLQWRPHEYGDMPVPDFAHLIKGATEVMCQAYGSEFETDRLVGLLARMKQAEADPVDICRLQERLANPDKPFEYIPPRRRGEEDELNPSPF